MWRFGLLGLLAILSIVAGLYFKIVITNGLIALATLPILRTKYNKSKRRGVMRGMAFDTNKLFNLLLIAMLIPSILQNFQSGNEAVATIMSFIPVLLVVDMLGVDPTIKKIINAVLILSIIPILTASISTDDPTVQTLMSILPIMIIFKVFSDFKG